MCRSEKCCFLFQIQKGCVLGVLNFIFSAITCVTSVVFLTLEESSYSRQNFQEILKQVHFNKSTFDIVLWTAFAIGLISMVFCAVLFVGLKKRISGLVLSYFAFGIFHTIIGLLSGLLALLASHWTLSAILFIASALNIHFLVVVQSMYEDLQKQPTSLSSYDELFEELIE